MELKKELEFYKSQYKKLISRYENQFALITGNKLLGCFTTESEAYEAGLEKLGNQPFLIKKVIKGDDIERAPALVLGLLNASL